MRRRQREKPRKALKASRPLVDLRIGLHGAGAERAELRIDAVLPLAQAHEVTERLRLAHLWKRGRLLALKRTERGCDVDGRHIQGRQRCTASPRSPTLENARLRKLSATRAFEGHFAIDLRSTERVGRLRRRRAEMCG